jgi:MFS family permease
VHLWMVYAFAFALGCVTAVDNPTRQAFVSEMVGPDDLTNAIGLNSATFNAARIIGPAAAAVVIKTVGLSPAFFVNAASYIAVLAGLMLMRPNELFRTRKPAREPGQVRAGLRYVWATPDLRLTILLVAVVATFGLNLSVVLPLLAKFTFHGDAGTYGLLTSSMAVGALGGALVAARRELPSQRLLAGMAIAFGVFSVFTALAPTLLLAVVALIPTGATAISFMATANSTLQLRSEAHMRGRVMALYALVFLGSTPLGGPLTGWVSQVASPQLALGLEGLITAAGGIAAWVYLGKVTRSRAIEADEVPTTAMHAA